MACGDGSEVFECVEEALDEVAVSIEVRTEGGDGLAVAYGFDTGPRVNGGAKVGQRGGVNFSVIPRQRSPNASMPGMHPSI